MTDFFPIDWSQFHFLRPVFLWLLVPVGVIGLLGLFGKSRKTTWERLIAPHLRPYLINKGNERTALIMRLLFVLGMMVGAIALAGPTWHEKEQQQEKVESPMFILLKLSRSMLEDDLQPSRLELVKFKVQELLDAEPGARTALIAYAGTAHRVVPLTEDYRIINDHLRSLSPAIMPREGNDLKQALALADSLTTGIDAPARIVLFADEIDQQVTDILLAYANTSRHNLEIVPVNLNPESIGDNTDAQVLDKNVMARLDANAQLRVNYLTLDASDMELLAKRVKDDLEFTKDLEDTEPEYTDMGWYFIFPVMLIFILWFRRGWVIYLLPLLLTSCGDDSRFADLWFTRDYQGQKLSDKGDYNTAAERYEDVLRKGVALYKAGNYEAAKTAFQRDSTAEGYYNLGLTLLQTGDTLAAANAFDAAVDLSPDMAAAQKNREIVKGWSEASLEEAQRSGELKGKENTVENKDMEDLGGGGQEATEEDMKKERKSETAETDIRMGRETDLPPDPSQGDALPQSGKIMMRKVNEDPAEFLRKKFQYQVRTGKVKPGGTNEK